MNSVVARPVINPNIYIPQNNNSNKVSVKSSSQSSPDNTFNAFLPGREIKGLYLNGITIAPAKTNEPYKNDLRTLFKNNDAVIMAVVIRTWNAKDKDGNGYITSEEEHGTFLNAIDKLDDAKKMGVNTLHVLPVNTPGKKKAMGTAGSIYAPADLLEVDPMLSKENDPQKSKEDFKTFVNECHKRGIRVMLDLPSCASVDLYEKRPELMAKDENGLPKIPQGWNDIRMFAPFKDEKNRVLNDDLVDLHKKFVDMCIDEGVDGIRIDVARAKPVEFWDKIIPYARSKDPEFAFLAETYTYEDASPMLNMPADRPEDSLKIGCDSYYSQYHNFATMGASELNDLVVNDLGVSQKYEKGKSVIGSFATHDDISPMSHGGADYCDMTTVLQSTLPMMNPYFVSGFESGDAYDYSYGHKLSDKSQTDCNEYVVHPGNIDIFNLSRAPGGKNPEIGKFWGSMMTVRQKYNDVITKGSYIPLKVEGDNDDKVIAYARHYNGKTLVVVANKDVNFDKKVKIDVPGLSNVEPLQNLAPSYGKKSRYKALDGQIDADLGPARAHIFEVTTPNIESQSKNVYKQNL